MMDHVMELKTPVGVFRVSDGERTIPFDIRKNRFLDSPWKVRDDEGIAVGVIDTDAKYSIYIPLGDLETDRDYTITFSNGVWEQLGVMDTGYCYHTLIDDWVVGIGGQDPDESHSIYYAVYPLDQNNGYRFRIFDKVRANAHFDVAWVQTGPYRLKNYEDALYSWLYARVRIREMKEHPEDPFRELEERLWQAIQNRDAKAFPELVNEDAVMVRGGYRYTGAEYAGIIKDFNCKSYQIDRFEIVCNTAECVQTHYIVTLEAEEDSDQDLAGKFHITTSWRKKDGIWKVAFYMDRRIDRS